MSISAHTEDQAVNSSQDTAESNNECLHDDLLLRPGTPEYEFEIAAMAIAEKNNLPHGAEHLAALLAFDPARKDWLELLNKYLDSAASEPESLFPSKPDFNFALEALRAYVWQKQGRLTEAIDLLLSVFSAAPDSTYLDNWVCNWLEPEGKVESLAEDIAWQLFATILCSATEFNAATSTKQKKVQRWSSLCQRFVNRNTAGGTMPARTEDAKQEGTECYEPNEEQAEESQQDREIRKILAKFRKTEAEEIPTEPQQDPDYVTMVQAGLLRKAGQLDDAETLVRTSMNKSADWLSAISLGLVLREKNQIDEAEDAFKLAIRLEPGDLSARIEAGDMRLNEENWSAALSWYETALSLKPTDECAYPSILYCNWMKDRSKKNLSELVELAHQGNQRARRLYSRAFGAPQEPGDGSAIVLRQIRSEIQKNPEDAPRGELSLQLSGLEAPSNYIAFELEMASLNHDLKLKVSVDEIPDPDPRIPIQDCRYTIWQYEGTEAKAALPAPGEDITQMISHLAASRFDDSLNWAGASKAADELGKDRLPEILAVLTHPPPPPDSVSSLKWLPRVHLVALQVAAQIDEGWDGSARKDALLSVLFGPRDWITNAAIKVLTYIAESEPQHAAKIGDAFTLLAEQHPRIGHCCWEHTLYSNWLRLPHLFASEREAIEKMLFQLER